MGPKGPGRASKGSGEAFRFIWTKFQPKWAHLGPIRAPFSFSISPKPILGPNSSKSIIPNEVLGPWGPGWGERAAPGGRRPTFRRGVGGRSPPTATRGVWGGGSPPTEKGPLELLPIAKSGTLRSALDVCTRAPQAAHNVTREKLASEKETTEEVFARSAIS